jgi:amino acid adenylation domain-containing protein
MANSSQSLTGLSPEEKRRLLAELLRKKVQESQAVFPLSHGQRGLWFLYQMNRGSAAYNISFPCRMHSCLDLSILRRVVETLQARHPSMRTSFEENNGELMQRVHDKIPVVFEVIDASSWSEETLRRRVQQEAHRPFDLEKPPLARMYLFSRSADDRVFLLTAHHIIGDYWSLVLLMEELRILYPAERDGTPPNLPPLKATYRDFVRWQADLLASPEGERLWSYWRKQLAGVPTVLDLPTDRPRPPRLGHGGSAASCRLGADLTRRLRALAVREHVTLYTVLVATFQVLLSRYTGQDDFVIGSPFSGRSRPEFEGIIGYFINMLPLRANLAGDPTFREYLRDVSATILGALEHQDFPFPLLVERLNLQRDPSRTPLVQASFILEKAHRSGEVGASHYFLPQADIRLNVGGLQSEPYSVELQTCPSDLEMVLEEVEGSIDGMLRFNTDLFEAPTVARMVEHFRNLLEAAASNPEVPVSQMPLLTEAERYRVVQEWNNTRADYPTGLCLHQLFEQQVQRNPAAIALSFGERTISYGELNVWTNRLAHRLHRLGVKPGVLVALCFERSPEMVAAILATLKAGGAFVPLDPMSPTERLRVVLADTQAPIVLTQRHLMNRLPAIQAEVISLDPVESMLGEDEESRRPPASGVQPTDLAYVIYTSGSTGRPKGVMVEHHAICNTVWWHQQQLTVRSGDRLLLVVPYFFDAALSILFPALAGGARVVLAEPGEEYEPARLLERIARERVTILPVPPRPLRLLMEGPVSEKCRTVRWVCTGGEAMPPDLPGRLFDLLKVDFYNLYGPTEVAVDATCWPCQRGDTRPSVPIGRPIANVQVYVLDRHRQPVPIGVPGELFIGGAGVARGYLHDPELTAERFLPDPFRDEPGARLYRTGDRCRWLPDGSLEFLGRLDQQVKVRGYRIEIGEVETALASHPSVREAAVTIHVDATGEGRLVGYVVPEPDGPPPTPEQLRRHLKDRLPDYMVPSIFVPLAELPHTPTGKLDRKALPAPLNERPQTSQPFVAPRTPLEEYLAGLWRDVLRLDQVGVEDNFFDLGGNSIQAALLVNRLREHLGEHIFTVVLFDSPTITGIVHHLTEQYPQTVARLFGPESLPASARGDRDGRSADPSSFLLVPLQPHGSRPPFFMVHPPGGIVVCYQLLGRYLGGEHPLYGIRARGLQGDEALPTRLEDMAAEYVAAIRAVQPQGPYHLGGWSMGGIVALEMAQQLLAQGQEVGLLVLLDTTIPVNETNREYADETDLSGKEYGLDMTLEELDRLGPDEQLPYLWDHVKKLGLVEADTPMELAEQILNDLKRLFHAHAQMANDYVVRHYPGRITLFRPLESPFQVPIREDRGWGRLAQAVEVHFVPGHHHSMVKEPHVQALAQELRACLERVAETVT